MPPGSRAVTLPLGPSTRTVLPLTVYLTPVGSGIGFLPIRDMMNPFVACESRTASAYSFHCSRRARGSNAAFTELKIQVRKDLVSFSLPDFAENLAADTFAT